MANLEFRDYGKYDLFHLLYLAKVEQVGHDELRESAVALTGDYEEAFELIDFLQSLSLIEFTDTLEEEWTDYAAARCLGFTIGWHYGISLNDLLLLLYKYWVAEASQQEIFEDALAMIEALGNVQDKMVANALTDYILETDPGDFEDRQLETWLEFKAKIRFANAPDIEEMGKIEGYAIAFQHLHTTGRCDFNRKEFGSAWDEIADGVIENLQGFKCDHKIKREPDHIFVYVLD